MSSSTNPPSGQVPSPATKTLFAIKASPDGMSAHIPAKSHISPDVIHLNYEQICAYLQKLGYILKPTPEAVEEIKRAASSKPPQFSKDFLFLKGIPYTETKGATIRWLNPITMPKDLVRPNIPFAIIKQAAPATPAKSIFGQEFPMPPQKGEPKKIIVLTPDPAFTTNEKGELVCDKGGQVVVSPDGQLKFEPVYTIKNLRVDQMKKIEFHCSVIAKCDIIGALEWVIHGDFTCEQFWSATGITVHGNAVALSGIQTNHAHDDSKAIIVNGNLEANFIQSSCFIVEGNIKVEKAILASRITTNGNLECLGEPGKITGSEIFMKKGTLNVKKVGSEKEKPTYIKFFSETLSSTSKIETLSEGSRIQIQKTNIIIQNSQPWPSPTK
ncbi:FapA family protein [Fluviispira vulneris]|uniref:FapA family protein n=1 Tax=Fluviispira vulneris TaxID=2763012 RepID=UPI0016469B35|nr:FapA family protein [Fluviispira vulneris]